MRLLSISLITGGIDKGRDSGEAARPTNAQPRTNSQRDFVAEWTRARAIGGNNLVIISRDINVDTEIIETGCATVDRRDESSFISGGRTAVNIIGGDDVTAIVWRDPRKVRSDVIALAGETRPPRDRGLEHIKLREQSFTA